MRRAMIFLALALMACTNRPVDDPLNPHSKVTWVDLGARQIPILNEGTAMADAAATIRARFPNLAAANDDPVRNWRDAHPTFGVLHGELSGFGVTMVLQTNNALIPGPQDFAEPTGALGQPTLLFFERTNSLNERNWPIIGMGYGFVFADEDGDDIADPPTFISDAIGPFFAWNLLEAFFFIKDGTLIHEAGYHLVAGAEPGFDRARTADILPPPRAAGLTVDADGHNAVRHEDLANRPGEHGRIWAIHVWFDPATGRPTVAPCDPWARQRPGAARLPPGTFYYRDDPLSRVRVAAQCAGGGVYPTIAAAAP